MTGLREEFELLEETATEIRAGSSYASAHAWVLEQANARLVFWRRLLESRRGGRI